MCPTFVGLSSSPLFPVPKESNCCGLTPTHHTETPLRISLGYWRVSPVVSTKKSAGFISLTSADVKKPLS